MEMTMKHNKSALVNGNNGGIFQREEVFVVVALSRN